MTMNLFWNGLFWLLMMLTKRGYTYSVFDALPPFEHVNISKRDFPNNQIESFNEVEKATKKITGAAEELQSAIQMIKAVAEKLVPSSENTVSIPGDNGVEYKIYHIDYNELKDFDGAHKRCVSMGYKLAAIENQKEFELLSEYLTGHYKKFNRFWTSGNDIAEKDNYVWHGIHRGQKAEIDSSWWWFGEPSHTVFDGVMEQCIEIVGDWKHKPLNPKQGFKLNDYRCAAKKYPICEEIKHQF